MVQYITAQRQFIRVKLPVCTQTHTLCSHCSSYFVMLFVQICFSRVLYSYKINTLKTF
jgi:hypothetical protein